MVCRVDMPNSIRGLYGDNVIWLNKNLLTRAETACALGEEMGHCKTTVGDILDQKDLRNRKQERRAREWSHDYLAPLEKFIEAFHDNVVGRYELSEYLGITEQVLQEAVDRYKDKYGLYVDLDERYTLWLDPLSVIDRYKYIE